MAGSIPMPKSGDSDCWISNFTLNPQVESLIEKLAQDYPMEYTNLSPILQQSCYLKFREIIMETVNEYNRKQEFVRIYPAKNSKMYDRFFSKSSLNKIIHKALFTSELLPYGIDLNELTKATVAPSMVKAPLPQIKQIARIQSASDTR